MCHHICVSKFMLSVRNRRVCVRYLKFKTSNGQCYCCARPSACHGCKIIKRGGYLFEVRAPVIVYHSGDVASIANASYDVMFLFLATLSLYRRDWLLLYEFWSSTSCKTCSLSVEDQLRPRPLLLFIIIIIIKYSMY